MISGTSHWMFEQAPQKFCEIVLEFLGSVLWGEAQRLRLDRGMRQRLFGGALLIRGRHARDG